MNRMLGLTLAALALFLIVMMFVPTPPDADSTRFSQRTTYSTGRQGARAWFLLLQKMGMQATALRLSTYAQQPDDATLWILGKEPLGLRDRRDLHAFMERGGHVVTTAAKVGALLAAENAPALDIRSVDRELVMTDAPELTLYQYPDAVVGAPTPAWVLAETKTHAPVVAGWLVGQGVLVSLGVPEIVENKLIGQGDNGIFLAHLAVRLGKRHVFDEVKTGMGERDLIALLASTPYRWGVAQAMLAGVVALAGLAIRRYPIRPAPTLQRRRTLDHIDAVARLWQRARDAGLPMQVILRATRERAAARVGADGKQEPFVRWMQRVKPELTEQAEACWQQAEALAQAPAPNPRDVQTLAAQLRQLEDKGASW